MNKQLQIFKYSDGDHLDSIRSIDIDGEIWFVAADVTGALGYSTF